MPVISFCTAVIVETLGSMPKLDTDTVQRVLGFVLSALNLENKAEREHKVCSLFWACHYILRDHILLKAESIKVYMAIWHFFGVNAINIQLLRPRWNEQMQLWKVLYQSNWKSLCNFFWLTWFEKNVGSLDMIFVQCWLGGKKLSNCKTKFNGTYLFVQTGWVLFLVTQNTGPHLQNGKYWFVSPSCKTGFILHIGSIQYLPFKKFYGGYLFRIT